jgi:hypothetical protein
MERKRNVESTVATETVKLCCLHNLSSRPISKTSSISFQSNKNSSPKTELKRKTEVNPGVGSCTNEVLLREQNPIGINKFCNPANAHLWGLHRGSERITKWDEENNNNMSVIHDYRRFSGLLPIGSIETYFFDS